MWESTRFLYLSLCDGGTTCTHTKIDKRHLSTTTHTPFFLPVALWIRLTRTHARTTLHIGRFRWNHHHHDMSINAHITSCISLSLHFTQSYPQHPRPPFYLLPHPHINTLTTGRRRQRRQLGLCNNRQQSINTFMPSAAWMKRESKQNELTRQHVHSSPYICFSTQTIANGTTTCFPYHFSFINIVAPARTKTSSIMMIPPHINDVCIWLTWSKDALLLFTNLFWTCGRNNNSQTCKEQDAAVCIMPIMYLCIYTDESR